jgi:hypothetical protein
MLDSKQQTSKLYKYVRNMDNDNDKNIDKERRLILVEI